MRLIKNKAEVLKKAHSVHLHLLGMVLDSAGFLALMWPSMDSTLWFTPQQFIAVGMGLNALGFIGRFVDQGLGNGRS